MNRRTVTGIGLAFGAAAISGLSVFVNGYGVHAVRDATVYTTAKNLVAAVVIGIVTLAVAGPRVLGRDRLPRAELPPAAPSTAPRSASTAVEAGRPAPARLSATARRYAGLAAVAVIGGSVPFVLFFEGLARASSTHAAFVQKTLVVWVAALAIPLLGERVRTIHVAAMGLIVGGLVLLDGGLRGFRLGDGETLILAATLLWAVEVIVAKRLLRGVTHYTLGLARMGGGAVVLVGWLAATGRFTALAHMGARGWTWSLVTGVILAGYVITWFAALSRAGAIDVTAALSIAAVITAVLNLAVKGTALPSTAGLILLTAGALLVTAGRRTATKRVNARWSAAG
jgi:drug/metabolite transporter (DMT)-like permease